MPHIQERKEVIYNNNKNLLLLGKLEEAVSKKQMLNFAFLLVIFILWQALFFNFRNYILKEINECKRD